MTPCFLFPWNSSNLVKEHMKLHEGPCEVNSELDGKHELRQRWDFHIVDDTSLPKNRRWNLSPTGLAVLETFQATLMPRSDNQRKWWLVLHHQHHLSDSSFSLLLGLEKRMPCLENFLLHPPVSSVLGRGGSWPLRLSCPLLLRHVFSA